VNEFALKILLTLSTFLGAVSHPAIEKDWVILQDWEQTEEGYLRFVAESKEIACECIENPTAFIEFPTTIHSSSQVLLGNQIIATNSSPDFNYTRGFYGVLVIPCYLITNRKETLRWEVISYTQYFAWFKHFPRVVEKLPIGNFFKETLHIGAAFILLILCLLYLIIFWGKITLKELLVLVLSNAFTAIYFIGSVIGLMGLEMSMLTAHRLADIGVWVGFLFFMHFFYMQGLLLRWMNILYKIFAIIGLTIIAFGKTGDTIQLGTTFPFLLTGFFIFYSLLKLMNKNLIKHRKNVFQFLALTSFLIGYCNDVLIITGFSDKVPLAPIAIIGSYVFILLYVNEKITKTYIERDELKVLAEELKQVNLNLKNAQSQLIKSEKMAAMGRAVARIAHELNTPIASARAAAQNIDTETLWFLSAIESHDQKGLKVLIIQYKNDLQKMIKILMYSVTRSAELVRSFKEIAVDQTNVQKKEFELFSYIKNSLTTMEVTFNRQQINVNLQGDQVVLHSDPGLFYQIIENLIANAAKYAYEEKGGFIDITIARHKDTITLLFADYGNGIPSVNLSKIFDAFFTTGGGKGGTGLGLNIVYRIVKIQLKGTITCESEEGLGTTFTIIIPRRNVS
jgi:signal transduction histidine kinase